MRLRTIGIVALVLIVGAYTWAKLHRHEAPKLATSPVTVSNIENTVLAVGTLEAVQLVSVGAQASGQIKELKVSAGDRVKAGDLIAQIDATTQINDVKKARAALANLRAQRNVQVALLKQYDLAFERQKMMAREDSTSRADYEQAEANLATTHAQIAALDAQIEQGQTTLDTAQANLGYTKITAPMDGTVVAVVVREGQTVNAVQTTPTIVKLAQLDTIRVNAQISEADVIKVKPGQTAYFTVLGDPDKRYYGKLRTIDPAPKSIETDSGIAGSGSSSSSSSSNSAVYYNGLFEVPNPDGALRISMTAQVYVVLEEAKDALTIPSAALGPRGKPGHYTVNVVGPDGNPQPRDITVGINNNITAQVTSGVKAGEKVVVGQDTGELSDTMKRMQARPRAF